ncbi:MAG: bifunctional phosphoribosylaminoimidazolecarboxamide formyltransferase/IMP cyclohydrolase, partial [Inquilinus sp.]|nr:bifunctional phosphoribosylaminoimidazolecarboxamide formyltransferase/IMP cyclohydrolase [Inquilinus sp.]
MTDQPIPIRRALISVYDKTGVVDLARFLVEHGVELLSTGGSYRALAEAGLPVVEVSAHTGFPEIMDGRVKTLHPTIHGGLLGRRDDPAHVAAMQANGIAPIDLLVSNLYPFEETVAAGGDYDACVENIDIGGPAMIRAAAKNHAFVAVVTDPADYPALRDQLATGDGGTSHALRQRLAAAAYARTAAYDAAVSAWFAGQLGDALPERLSLAGQRVQSLRYGENPHQKAALYRAGPGRPGVLSGRQVQGKELSFNNINDADAAFELAAEFDRPAIVIVKHANPCGVAVADDLASAYAKALACDPVSAFGGIIAANRPLDEGTAVAIGALFAEVVIVPEAEPAALERLSAKKNLRVVLTGGLPDPAGPGLLARSGAGGLMVQD